MGEANLEFFQNEKWTAGVVGLGYVGLPLAMAAVDAGLPCIGYDVSEETVAHLTGGCSHVEDVPDATVAHSLENGFRPTTDPALLREADAIFSCVPSPLGRHRQPDMSYIVAAADAVAHAARSGQFISLESTSYPGTTEEVLVPALLAKGFVLDLDLFVAFSPERIDPGNERLMTSIPKVVGGVSPLSGRVAAAVYGRLVSDVHIVSSAKAAEMAKLLENTYRAVNIALINEMARLAHELGIDIWEVVDAAASKPFGFEAFYPGPGVGGHCIPLDPQFLAWRAKEVRFATRFIDLAEQVNTAMPAYAAARVADLLNEHDLATRGAKVLGVGVAYKANIGDDRESPALDVLAELARRGAEILVLDPLVNQLRIKEHGFIPVNAQDGVIGECAVAVILANHDVIDLDRIAEQVPLVLDTRNAFRRRGINRANVVTL